MAAQLQIETQYAIQGLTGNQSARVDVPVNAVAVIGVTILQGAFTRHANLELVSSENTRICSFDFFRGRKSSVGCLPLSNATFLVLNTSTAAADSAVVYNVLVHFLVVQAWDGLPFPALPAVPFKCEGGDDAVVVVSATSAATTAQTVDIAPLGNTDGIQLLAAWFQTNGPSTATGNAGFWDGTIRTDYDNTAAVAGYVFNLGAKQNFAIADNIGTGLTFRFVIGAAAAGTTTLYIVYKAFLLR